MKSLIKDHKNLFILLTLLGLIFSQAWYFYQTSRFEEELLRFTSYKSGLLNQPLEDIDTIRVTDPRTNRTTSLHRPGYLVYSLGGILAGFLLGLVIHFLINRKKRQ